jgi:hypothetical protein
MESHRHSLLKSAMTYGAILGIFLAAFSFLMFLFNIFPVGFLVGGLVVMMTIATFYIGIYLSTKKIRNIIFNGNLTYKQGLMVGTLITMFAAIIFEFYIYIQDTILDPDYVSRLFVAQKAWYLTLHDKIAQVQIDNMISELDEGFKNYNALDYFFQYIFFFTVVGFILSLITSAFLKTKTTSKNLNEESPSQI